MAARRSTLVTAVAVLLIVAALAAGQASADALAPPSGRSGTGRLLGRTSFAYLTGIRTYIAAVLWARLDPVNDGYYQRQPLAKKRFLLPSIRMVTLLDPAFEEPFYVGPWILYEAGMKDGAYRLAREGIVANPGSGFLHAAMAQLLLSDGRFPEAAREADLAMSGTWPSDSDRYDLLTTLEIAYNKTGQSAKAAAVRAEEARLKARLGTQPAPSPAPAP